MSVLDRVGQAPMDRVRRAGTKVPEVTLYFWGVKVLTTAMGETTSDFMNQWIGPMIAVPIMLVALWVALRLQFRRARYTPWSYWLVVVTVAVFGTTAADALHVVLGIPYLYSTAFYAILLAAIFVVWFRSERTLSIHTIYTRRREQFYWATVLATFALGTAAGDLTATPLHVGFFDSGLMFAGVIALPAVAYWLFGVSEIFTFWFAYIVTRPLGASFSDWMAVTRNRGGLNIGPGTVSALLTVVIIALVGYLAYSHVDSPDDAESHVATDRSPRVLEPVGDEI